MQKELGGKRLGSGKGMNVEMHNYHRSTHNFDQQFRSTMAPGTLVPFFIEPGLPGDTWDIDLEALIKTHPTVGPVYGSFKFQLDIFEAPIRLYNRQLHNDKLDIGNHMERVIFPKMVLRGKNIDPYAQEGNLEQIAPDSVIAYLGQMGLGKNPNLSAKAEIKRIVNGMSLLAYWEIVKNYYANKQEEIGVVIENNKIAGGAPLAQHITIIRTNGQENNWPNATVIIDPNARQLTIRTGDTLVIKGTNLANEGLLGQVRIDGDVIELTAPSTWGWGSIEYDPQGKYITYRDFQQETVDWYRSNGDGVNGQYGYIYAYWDGTTEGQGEDQIKLTQFPLSNIDDMRELILQHENGTPLLIGAEGKGTEGEIGMLPYLASTGITYIKDSEGNDITYSNSYYPMAGLALKTYQSDRFNNWLNTEWIDGPGGITEITAIDTSGGSFTMDTLNLQKKLYMLLNRIAVAGGSYKDWMEAVYGDPIAWRAETPMYCGGMSTRIMFGDVVSSSEAGDEPLGTLAGRGREFDNMEKGGRVRIKVKEPSMIIGIASITPIIDYSQGNKFTQRWDTMNDLHKPGLDGIGFQELITDELAAFDTDINNDGTITYKSIGKQPSWIEYMTAWNRCYGNFARPRSEMYMTLNRQYAMDTYGNLEDATTYIDPEKYNYIFAVKKLTEQGFWVQIGMGVTARRVISAKIIPNL